MNSFKRTLNGLNNQHIFYKVDFVVYVEGGISYNKQDVYAGLYSEESVDVIFWTKIFYQYKPQLTFKFKAVGSKKTLLNIAEDIFCGLLNKAYVAFDSEFDEFTKQKINHKQIIYTYGYSWENDVWSTGTIKAVVEELTAKRCPIKNIQLACNKFLKEIKLSIFADFILFKKENSFLPRTGYLSCVTCDLKDFPKLKTVVIEDLFTKKNIVKKSLYYHGKKLGENYERVLFGHLWGDYCCHIVIYLLKKVYKMQAVNKEVINRVAINKFSMTTINKEPYFSYYSKQMA